MVPLKTPFLTEVRRTLEEAVSGAELSQVEEAFCYWLEPSQRSISELTAAAVAANGAARSYLTIAFLGFVSAVDSDTAVADALRDGLTWLLSRPLKRSTGDLQEYVGDSLALFGFSLSVETLDEGLRPRVREWIENCLRASYDSFLAQPHKAAFAEGARKTLSIDSIAQFSGDPVTSFCLRHRLGESIDRATSDNAFIAVQKNASSGVERLQAIESLYVFEIISSEATTIDLERPTLAQLVEVLDRVGSVMYRWPYGQGNNSTWEMNNEYDFQALVYAVLSPIFKDLKDEEWLQSIGPKKPRADLVIPSLSTVIEVKYRRKERMSEFIGQIAEDKSLYLQRNSPYRHIVVALWDDAQATEEHEVLRQGVRELELDGVSIVSRPARMTRTTLSDSRAQRRTPKSDK